MIIRTLILDKEVRWTCTWRHGLVQIDVDLDSVGVWQVNAGFFVPASTDAVVCGAISFQGKCILHDAEICWCEKRGNDALTVQSRSEGEQVQFPSCLKSKGSGSLSLHSNCTHPESSVKRVLERVSCPRFTENNEFQCMFCAQIPNAPKSFIARLNCRLTPHSYDYPRACTKRK